MKRCFISRISECVGLCEYCFAKWDNYIKFAHPENMDDNTIIYPNCDGNMFDDHFDEMIQFVEGLSDKKVSVSISTKFHISDSCIQKLKELHEHCCRNNGIVKLSLSFSCERSIPIIEKNTAAYKERIEQVKKICDNGIPYVTVIKPILPFIDIEEYTKIIDDTIGFSPYYLLGDLYVSKNTDFYKKYIEGKYPVKEKEVLWNGANGHWDVVEDVSKKEEIENYIVSHGGVVFYSDADAIEYIKNTLEDK